MIWFESDADAITLRDLLIDRGYTEPNLREMLGKGILGTPGSNEIRETMHALREFPRLGLYVTLFLHGLPVDAAAATAAFAPMGLSTLAAGGLLRVEGQVVSPELRLTPFGVFEPIFVPCDVPSRLFEQDSVMGTSTTSVAVALSTIARPGARMLDLCAGSGFQSLVAAQRCGSIVATEVNERAIAFGRFAAQLNGVTNIEFRHGAGLDPARGDRFDAIACNPPFVISPESTLTYRDGLIGGERLAQRFLRDGPGHLRNDGWMTILLSWPRYRGQEADAEPRAWVKESGCDVLLLVGETGSPQDYASNWLSAEPAGLNRLPEWLAYYEREGIEEISTGLAILHRVAGRANWFATEVYPDRWLENASESLRKMFAAQEFLALPRADEALLDSRLTVSLALAVERESGKMRIRSNGAMLYEEEIDTATLTKLAAMRAGQMTIRAAFGDAAASMLPAIRRYLTRGYVRLLG